MVARDGAPGVNEQMVTVVGDGGGGTADGHAGRGGGGRSLPALALFGALRFSLWWRTNRG